jgi:selenide,water dikinase
MGGEPRTALNLVAFPIRQMDISVLRQIIQGGIDKMKEADVVLIGGHSIEDDEIKFGFSVTGLVHPDRVITKKDIRAGDKLLLTKPLGTGIINTAIKGGLASPEAVEAVTRMMTALNRAASDVMRKYPVHACTDITGFGLLGHLAEMVDDSGLALELKAERIPLIPRTLEYAGMGMVPGGAYNNMAFRRDMVVMSDSVDELVRIVLYDPQTSGGLLICVENEKADELLADLKENGIFEAACIGEVTTGPAGKIVVD